MAAPMKKNPGSRPAKTPLIGVTRTSKGAPGRTVSVSRRVAPAPAPSTPRKPTGAMPSTPGDVPRTIPKAAKTKGGGATRRKAS